MPKKFAPSHPASFEELLARVRQGRLTRRRFLAIAAAAGASAAAVATLAEVLKHPAHAPAPAPAQEPSGAEQQNLQLHQQHLDQQQRRTNPPSGMVPGGPLVAVLPAEAAARVEPLVQKLMEDYHEDAVVEDMLMEAPIVGRAAIADRKRAEFLGISNAAINVTQRFAFGDQVIAEWVVTGTHSGDMWGFPATGQAITIRGLTAVTRHDGKISKESLYYDAADVRRQLTRAL